MLIKQEYFIYVDILIACIFILMIYNGYKKGFLVGVLNLVYTLLSIVASWFLCPILASMFPIVQSNNAGLINNLVNVNEIINSVIYFVVIFLVLKLLHLFLILIFKSFNNIPIIGSINKLLGSAIGLINAFIIVLALSLLFTLPIFKNGKEIINGTLLKHTSFITSQVTDFIFTKISTEKFNIDIDMYRDEFKEWLNTYLNEQIQ